MVIDGGATCTSAPLIFRKGNDTECKGQTATTEKGLWIPKIKNPNTK